MSSVSTSGKVAYTSPLDQKNLRRAAVASMVGTTLEWYEFVIYNSMAALIFNKIFFPQFDPMMGTILAFSTYAVGYLSRPFGGVILGRLGDRLGRKEVLFITLVLMGGATILIGCIPTYESIGIAAPIILIVIRFAQGVALGGEWAGAVLLSAEHGNEKNRGLHASWSMMGPSAGTLLATGALTLCTNAMSVEAFEQWGWRLPFLASVVLLAFGIWVRWGVSESPVFTELEKSGHKSSSPIKDIFNNYPKDLILAAGARIGPDVAYGLLSVFILAYLTQTVGAPRSVAITALLIGSVWHALSVPMFAALSDVLGRRVVYGAGAIALGLWTLVLFPMLQTKDPFTIYIGMSVALFLHAAMYGPQASFVMEQFGSRVRYSGSSLAYTLGGVLGGGFAPLIFAALQKVYPGAFSSTAYLWGALAITLVCLFIAKETAGQPLRE